MTKKVSQKQALIGLGQALLDHLFKYPTEGISLPYIQINLECGRIDRIVEYLNDFENRKIGAKKGGE